MKMIGMYIDKKENEKFEICSMLIQIFLSSPKEFFLFGMKIIVFKHGCHSSIMCIRMILLDTSLWSYHVGYH
jgi:hypothetical protein